MAAEPIREVVTKAMSERCAEQGHDYEDCDMGCIDCPSYCKWCGKRVVAHRLGPCSPHRRLAEPSERRRATITSTPQIKFNQVN